MELFLYVSRTPLVWTGAAFFFFFSALRGHLIVCKYYSLFEKESAPILIKLYT